MGQISVAHLKMQDGIGQSSTSFGARNRGTTNQDLAGGRDPWTKDSDSVLAVSTQNGEEHTEHQIKRTNFSLKSCKVNTITEVTALPPSFD
jgi:hypothetical protein